MSLPWLVCLAGQHRRVGLRGRWRRGSSGDDLPGVHGPARPAKPTAGDPAPATRALARRIEPGDIAVLDHLDLDRVSAEALAAAHPGAVVNVRPSLSGRHPARGAEVLVAAGIPVVDATGTGLLAQVREGGAVRVHEGCVYVGGDLVGQGTVQTLESVHEAQVKARVGMNVAAGGGRVGRRALRRQPRGAPARRRGAARHGSGDERPHGAGRRTRRALGGPGCRSASLGP